MPVGKTALLNLVGQITDVLSIFQGFKREIQPTTDAGRRPSSQP